MNLTEKQKNTKTLYDGKILKLCVDEVELPDGSESAREIVRHCGGAAVLFICDGKVALVRQYRYAYAKAMYEIPAGKVDKGEDAYFAAMRELEEETGYRAEKLTHLQDLYPSPGYTDEIIHIYFTDSAKFVGQKPDLGEFLDCAYLPLSEVKDMIDKGEICDAKSVAAVYKYLNIKSGKKIK